MGFEKPVVSQTTPGGPALPTCGSILGLQITTDGPAIPSSTGLWLLTLYLVGQFYLCVLDPSSQPHLEGHICLPVLELGSSDSTWQAYLCLTLVPPTIYGGPGLPTCT